jgi:hypothetical protein
LLVGPGVNYIVIGKKVMATKKEKFDGRSRPSNDMYRKIFDEIFKKEKTTSELLREGYEEEKRMLEDEEKQ